MRFSSPLIITTIVHRYKRFLVDVILPDGKKVTAHCANSGSMKTCLEPGWKAAISESTNPKRKLKYSLEMTQNGQSWIGVNTILANRLVFEAIENGIVKELSGYSLLRREVAYGENSRIDILLQEKEKKCFVEIKNVTLIDDDGYNTFPDAKTARGLKHLHELMQMVKEGHRAVMFFLVQRSDGKNFRPAKNIDPEYAATLKIARKAGVEILVYGAKVSPQEIRVEKRILNIEI